jgi:hypothetical protein
MRFTKYLHIITITLLLQVAYGCNAQPSNLRPVAKAANKQSASLKKSSVSDEQLFRQFLKEFKDAVKAKDESRLKAMFHFPLQTSPQWSNDELQNTTITPQDGLISQSDFAQYFTDIFTNDALKLIPASGEDDLAEIDKSTNENYYKTLQQVTDKGSTLFELQKQYTQDNGKETSFGFVFGKVEGRYKAISYYRPWPLKG